MKVVQSTKSLIQQKSQARMWTYGIVAVFSIAALFYIIPPVHNDNSNALTGTSIASDTTLSISLSGSVLPLDITPTSSAGTFASTASDSEEANTAVIHVATNNITGYTLGIKASNPNSSTADKLISNNEQCENTPTSTKCAINPLPQPVTEAQYIDNTMEGVDLNNTWGYLPSKYNSEDNTNYLPAPVSGDTIATTDSPNPENTTASDGTLQSDEYTIDYGMRIDYSPYAGTYSTNYNNQSYIITAVGNPVPYSVSYNANKPEQAPTEATVSNVPSAQTGTVSGGTTVAVILSSKVPTIGTTDPSTEDYTYAGYVFNGWCSVQPQEDQTTGYQTCPNDADIYHPGDNFGIDQTVDNTQTLYAVWGAPATVTFNANGLIYDNTATETTNIVDYIPTYVDGKVTGDKTNTIYTGTYKTPAYEETIPATNYILKGWSTDPNATEATFVNEQAITNSLDLNAGDNITLYAVWIYATVITFNGNGNDAGNTPMADITIEAGQTEALPQNTYTKDGYVFNGWNTVQIPTEQDPGEVYSDQADFTAGSQSADVTLYAQWVVPKYLYNEVKNLVKKSGDTELTQSATDLQAEITAPTTTDPSTDTSNSGVYKYDATTFGAASDADGSYAIYYYRGILEPTADNGTYGSDGKATTYPNYVRLANNTCWRIVRTTGSGGVKMIYNGIWQGTAESGTCANNQTNAQLTTSPVNTSVVTVAGKSYTGLQYQNMHAIGYTYSNVAAKTTSATALSTLLGATGNDTTTNTKSSIIKKYIEDWYSTNMINASSSSYTSMLEESAGYCNDRSVYNDGSYAASTVLPDSTMVIPYGTSGLTVYRYGAMTRNMNAAQNPSLTCPRGIVDTYSTTTTSGGNGQLTHPIALLTADELSFAGSGSSIATNGSSYNNKSYLRSGSIFWLLSPSYRVNTGRTREFILGSSYGSLDYGEADVTNGVRPAISLKHETTVVDGSGTATDPWLINE